MVDQSDIAFQKAFARVQQLRTRALFAVHSADRSFVERGWSDPIYVAGRRALDDVLIDLAQAKWTLGRVDGTYLGFATPLPNRQAGLEESERGFLSTIAACDRIRMACKKGVVPDRHAASSLSHFHEVAFAGDTPIVPAICPVVVLQGSNRDMGRQYVQQVHEIYGTWIFARQAAVRLSVEEMREVQRWASELERHTPEVLAFAAGMAEGAARGGVPLSYEQALAIWTGVRQPAKEPRPMAFAQSDGHDARITAAYLGVATAEEVDADMCSGICAWGRGTDDGSLVTGSTTDHDSTFMATIVAFPDEGYPFVYTPFSANGSIPVLGTFQMGGHPGMNAGGLAYVHHGGANTGEPVDQWGYGVRRGPATFHMLQSCGGAVAARDAHRDFPVGDAGISLGTVGGMFADSEYGFSLESRPGAPTDSRVIIREHSFDAYGGKFDFLYANNNAMAPESAHLNVPPPGGYQYSIAGGWFTLDWAQINADPGPKAFRRLNTRSSEGRNRYAYRMMMEGYGRVDVDYMTMVYRQSGEMPDVPFEQIQQRWQAGEPWNSSTAHRGNAFTAIMNPRRGEDGVYLGCVGPANRAVHPRGPEHGYYYYNETNAFWELRLRRDPVAVLDAAIAQAREDFERARKYAVDAGGQHPGAMEFAQWVSEAQSEIGRASHLATDDLAQDRDAKLSRIARALRCSTRAQVRARQVIEAIQPPPTSALEIRP